MEKNWKKKEYTYIHIYAQLNHFAVHIKLTQCCKLTIHHQKNQSSNFTWKIADLATLDPNLTLPQCWSWVTTIFSSYINWLVYFSMALTGICICTPLSPALFSAFGHSLTRWTWPLNSVLSKGNKYLLKCHWRFLCPSYLILLPHTLFSALYFHLSIYLSYLLYFLLSMFSRI